MKLVHERISTRSYPDWGMRLFCAAPKGAGAPREKSPRDGDLPAMIDAFFGFGDATAFAELR